VSVPAGLVDGLPVGLQVVAPVLGEALMLRAARALERDLDLPKRPTDVIPLLRDPQEARARKPVAATESFPRSEGSPDA
jgi:hypothetical protein